MKNLLKHTLPLIAAGGAALLFTGCETIVRENIISSIDTGVGATVAENKQTQMYEFKAGYIRSQFYSIPTGKLVKNENDNTALATSTNGALTHAQISNAANVTPQVVSGIKEHSGLADLLVGMDVSENFAVGEVAVMSPAAVAMYVASASNTNSAAAAASAVKNVQANINNIPLVPVPSATSNAPTASVIAPAAN